MTAKVSLIIPIYNAQRYLRECLESVAAQTMFDETEVLLVDDGSTDASGKLCDDFAENRTNVTVIHKQNGGVSAARNTGIERASGKYIAFADADDLLMPEMLEKLYTAAEQTGAELSFCAFEHPYPDKDVTITYPFSENTLLDKKTIRTQIAQFMIVDESFNALWNKLFLRQTVQKNGITLTEGKKYAEDREFVLRVLAVIDGACYVPYVGYYYRYVETGAIQKPRTDYGERIVEQHRDDCRKFAALGISESEVCRIGAGCLCARVVGALSFAENKLRGNNRRMVMHSILNDTALTALVDTVIADASVSRFQARILHHMRRKSIAGIRLTFAVMRVKVSLYNLLKGRK